MTVQEIMDVLSECDPQANVFMVSQPRWPFEFSVAGITTRENVTRNAGRDEDGEEIKDPDCAPSDVFICEGSQERYAPANVWENLIR